MPKVLFLEPQYADGTLAVEGDDDLDDDAA
ncbi:MAG: hypothetical protein JWO67_1788 [Streptosporangiaceae bacterium]|nr:hypothetical protein [Streptosporangiaceae bacterium]